MQTTESYGHEYYPTWVVRTWLTNQEGVGKRPLPLDIYGSLMEMANAAANPSDLAAQIKDLVEESAPEISGMYSDLLAWSIERIDWDEVAAAVWESRDPEDND